MSDIKISAQQKSEIIEKTKKYFEQELNFEIGSFDAEFLIDFFAKEFGGYYYNQGLQDAQSIIASKVIDIEDAIYEIEKPVG